MIELVLSQSGYGFLVHKYKLLIVCALHSVWCIALDFQCAHCILCGACVGGSDAVYKCNSACGAMMRDIRAFIPSFAWVAHIPIQSTQVFDTPIATKTRTKKQNTPLTQLRNHCNTVNTIHRHVGATLRKPVFYLRHLCKHSDLSLIHI